MATLNLTSESSVDTSKDSIVIRLNTFTLEGGRVLDVTGFAPDVIKAGHIIIQDTTSGEYKPNPISGTAFSALPEGSRYAGIVVASVDKVTQGGGVAIMTQGSVNTKAMPYTMTTAIEGALKTALNQIYFTFDNQ